MSSLRYYGKKADSDASVTTKGYADERRAAVSVTQTDVNNEVARQSNGLATKTYVNQQDATLADKSYVDTQDAKYANATLLGASSGVAKLNASSKVSGAPALSLAPRGPRIYTVNTGMSSYTNQTSQNVLLTSISIADPGYTYFPMVFGTFECITNSGADTRIDLGARWNSSSSTTYMAYGTSKLGDAYSRTPISLTPDAGGKSSYTGAGTIYITAFRGYGSGSWSIWGNTGAWVTVILYPI